jgi:hypothetical protein
MASSISTSVPHAFAVIAYVALQVVTLSADACTPHSGIDSCSRIGDTFLPCVEPDSLAFIGVVESHIVDAPGPPSITLRVLDAWTPKQRVGDRVTVQVTNIGCEVVLGPEFDPATYPIGTRVRFASDSHFVTTTDLPFALLPLGGPAR